jgi:hypothetical protein
MLRLRACLLAALRESTRPAPWQHDANVSRAAASVPTSTNE